MIRQYEQMRYDRVLAKMVPGWQPTSIEMVGTKPLDLGQTWSSMPGMGATAASAPVFPSDHFGLIATFEGPNSNLQR